MIDENEKDLPSRLKEIIETGMKEDFGFLIAGSKVVSIFSDEEMRKQALEIFKACKSAIVFRSSPAEKAKLVNFVKKYIKGSSTLAIGDGANDVNMIQ